MRQAPVGSSIVVTEKMRRTPVGWYSVILSLRGICVDIWASGVSDMQKNQAGAYFSILFYRLRTFVHVCVPFYENMNTMKNAPNPGGDVSFTGFVLVHVCGSCAYVYGKSY
jgi:hypothetical protein